MDKGESNTHAPGNYTCLFKKLIQYWRRVWNERTNGITDREFPFGFVQVSFANNFYEPRDIPIAINKH
jgi:sialate O-acetylesterase